MILEKSSLNVSSLARLSNKTLSRLSGSLRCYRMTKILAAKRVNSAADTSALKGEIDQLVYQLYGLSPEEINIVEGKV